MNNWSIINQFMLGKNRNIRDDTGKDKRNVSFSSSLYFISNVALLWWLQSHVFLFLFIYLCIDWWSGYHHHVYTTNRYYFNRVSRLTLFSFFFVHVHRGVVSLVIDIIQTSCAPCHLSRHDMHKRERARREEWENLLFSSARTHTKKMISNEMDQ